MRFITAGVIGRRAALERCQLINCSLMGRWKSHGEVEGVSKMAVPGFLAMNISMPMNCEAVVAQADDDVCVRI
jgi:hypothetical protein